MRVFIVFTLLFIILYVIGFVGKTKQSIFLDKRYTNQIKGFSVLTVVWAHGGDHLGIGGIQFVAGVGVAIFLICSGYGLEKSYEKNGLRGFWRKRFLKICIPLWIIEFVWECISNTLSFKNYANRALLLGGGGWYLRYLFVCYVIYYLIKLVSKARIVKGREKIVLMTAFGLFFIYECIWPWIDAIPFLRARQMFSFPVGVMLASSMDIIELKLGGKRKQLIFAVGSIAVGVLFVGLTQLGIVKSLGVFVNNILSLFTVLPLAVGVLLITKNYLKLLQNQFLYFIGMISYEIFLTQSFTQQYIEKSIVSALLYVLITIVVAGVLHLFISLPAHIYKKMEAKLKL